MAENLHNYQLSNASGCGLPYAKSGARKVFYAVEEHFLAIALLSGCVKAPANGNTFAQSAQQWLNQPRNFCPRLKIYHFWSGLDPEMVEFFGIAVFFDVIRATTGSRAAR